MRSAAVLLALVATLTGTVLLPFEVSAFQAVGRISVTPGATEIAVGESVQLSAQVFDRTGVLVGRSLSFATSSASISVSPSGLVRGITPGQATVTVSSGNVRTAVRITVTGAGGQTVGAPTATRPNVGSGDLTGASATTEPQTGRGVFESRRAALERAHADSVAAAATGLLGHYTFEGTPNSSGPGEPFRTTTRSLSPDGRLFVNGVYTNAPGGYAWVYVPQLDYLSFTVSFDFLAVEPERPILYGGHAYRWFGLDWRDGTLALSLNNHSFVHRYPEAPLAVRRWYKVIVSVDGRRGIVQTLLDGVPLSPAVLPPDFRLAVVGSERDASDRQFMFQDFSRGAAFHGYVDNLRILGRPLDLVEMIELSRQIANER